MDPQVTLFNLLDAIRKENRAEAVEMLEELHAWISVRRGNMPKVEAMHIEGDRISILANRLPARFTPAARFVVSAEMPKYFGEGD